jgi:aminobenzoyl-glutamate utilization protein B
MAATAVSLFLEPTLIDDAKRDHRARLEGRPFVNPIPDDVAPPIHSHRQGDEA